MTDVRLGSRGLSRGSAAFEWRLVHVGFVATGVVTTLLGPILPTLAANWSLNDKQAGFFFTVQFLGSLLGVLSTSFLLPRRGYAFVLAMGFALMAAGVAALGLGSWSIGCLSVFIYGIGLGLAIPAANLYVSSHAAQRSVAALSILNLAWSAGAVFCPLMVILAERITSFRGLTFLLGAILALLALVFAWIPRTGVPAAGFSGRRPMAAWTTLLRRPQLRLLVLLFFLYVGTENAVGGWVAAHAKRASSAFDSLWVLTPSVFWVGVLAGRALAPAIWRYLGSDKLNRLALAMAAFGGLAILLAGSPAIITAGAGLAGLGLAPIFPILVAWLTEAMGADAEWAGGMMFGAASLGGAVQPWLVGAISKEAGSLRVGLGVPVMSCLLMLYLAVRRTAARLDERMPEDELLPAARQR